MIGRAHVIGFGLLAAGLGLVVYAVTRGTDEPVLLETASERSGEVGRTGTLGGLRDLAAGTEHRYTVALDHASRPSEGASFSLAVDGEWALAVVPTTGTTTTTVRAELRQARIKIGDTTSPAPRMSVPYTFTIGSDGKLVGLQFPRDLDPETRVLLTALTASTQISDGGRAASWTAIETDSLGPYDAKYSRESTGAIHKTKVGYRKTVAAGDEPLAVQILGSTTEISLREDGWLSQLDQREELRVGLDKISVTVAGRVTLRHAGLQRGVVATLPLGLESVAIDATSTANRDAADRELLDGASLVDLLATLGSVRDDGNASAHTYLRLVALFRLDPEAAKAGGAAVIGGKLATHEAAAVIGALGEAGTNEAQHALVGVVDTSTLSADHRLHGAMSLGLTATPQPETIQALVTASRAADSDLSATATLALGNAALRLQNQDPADAARQVDELLARLGAATDDAVRVICLRALGNTGDVRVLPALEAALASPSDVVRVASVESLRLIPDVRADALVISALDDQSSLVRTGAVFSATYRPLDPVAHALAVRARIDDDVTVRRAIVELAGTRMRELPAVLRPIVTHAAEHDADPELRKRARELLG